MVNVNLLLSVASNPGFYKNVLRNFKEAHSGIQNEVWITILAICKQG